MASDNALKLATHMAEKGDVYVLDEPTSGLHLADVQQLLGLLDRLVDSGKSVIVIAHHQAVMAHADWIIDLGPGAGHDGGQIVFEGTPADIVCRSDRLLPGSTSRSCLRGSPDPASRLTRDPSSFLREWRFGAGPVDAYESCVLQPLSYITEFKDRGSFIRRDAQRGEGAVHAHDITGLILLCGALPIGGE